MGVNNDAVLVYGWVFDFEEFKELIVPYLLKNGVPSFDDTDEWLFLEERCCVFQTLIDEKFPSMRAGWASPYYDCEPSDMVFYITFDDVSNIPALVCSKGKEIADCVKLSEDLGLSKEPVVEALVNIN